MPYFKFKKINFEKNIADNLISMGEALNSEFSYLKIEDNSTSLYYSLTGVVKIKNNSFINNHNLSKLFFSNPDVQSLELYNNIFWNNNIKSYGPITTFSYPNYLTIKNNIFIHIQKINYFLTSNTETFISNSYFDTLSCATFPPSVTCGPGNLFNLDPMFVDTAAGNFHLQPCSPLLNAGDNSVVAPGETDLAGNPRIQGGIVDIGAYETPAPNLSAAPVATPACDNVANGAISFTPENGCPPYAYQWTSGNHSGQSLTGLSAGPYLFTITDARGASFSTSATIPVGTPVSVSPQPMPLICGDTIGGTAAVTVSGGTGPYHFNWGGIAQTDSIVSGLAAGNYPVTVTDAQGCTSAGTVNIDRTGGLTVSISVDKISCHGAADGSFTVMPTDGKSPYHWQWENGPESPAYGPLGPGTYQGTLTDAFGCSILWVLPLDDPDTISYTDVITSATDTIAPNGRIQLSTVTGGTEPYAINWSNGQQGSTISGLKPGTYKVTITDAHNCTATGTFLLSFTVDTNEPGQSMQCQVAPNPVSDRLLISGPVGGLFMLYDMLGRPMRSIALSGGAAQIGVADLPAGSYRWTMVVPGMVFRRGGIVIKL
jgi:hypothetical protein